MKMRIKVRVAAGFLAVVVSLVAAAGSGAAGGEEPVTVKVGTLPLLFNLGIAPKALPVSSPGRAALTLSLAELGTETGKPGPALREVTIGLDRAISLDPQGLPVCPWPNPELVPRRDCKAAVVGRARAEVLVAFPEEAPVTIVGHGRVYNRRAAAGVPRWEFELDFPAPIAGAVQIPASETAVPSGRIGSETTFRIPELAGGDAAATSLEIELARTFSRNGNPASYVTAECRDGKLYGTLEAAFADGSERHEESTRPCTPLR